MDDQSTSGFKFTKRITQELISIWGAFYEKIQSSKRNGSVYKEMTRQLNARLHLDPPATHTALVSKLSYLRKMYRKEKCKIESTGMDSDWWAYDSVAQIIGSESEVVNDMSLLSDSIQCMDSLKATMSTIDETLNFTIKEETFSPIKEFIVEEESMSSGEKRAIDNVDESDQEEPSKKRTKNVRINQNVIGSFNKLTLLPILQQTLDIIFDDSDDQDSDTEDLILKAYSVLSRNQHKRSLWVKPKSTFWYDQIVKNMTDHDFREHFKLSLCSFDFLVRELKNSLKKHETHLRDSIKVEKRVAIALHYLSSCEELSVVSALFGVGKSTAHSIIKDFVKAVNNILMHRLIKFPKNVEELKSSQQEFENVLHFPQSIGAMHSFHVPVGAPKEHAASYCNSKGYHSIVLLAVVDAKQRFTYICVGSPGRNNDARVLNISSLNSILQSRFFDSLEQTLEGVCVPITILGDSSFPLKRHLLKPYPEHHGLNEEQRHFNDIFYEARKVVKNAFGKVQSRFRVMYKQMECEIDFCSEIIKCCCILHNICEYLGDECSNEELRSKQTVLLNNERVSIEGDNGPGKKVRDAIAKFMFNKKGRT